ncbi:hypothetical protein EYF80_041205 [Liparis tanakae]|uniref:Uncharacterized protein n=1 Tax=Liparis tanakae TaxID=230148 RepID=A0A4Z2G4T6_9TELE|nr:hypothetical protein EYF80_041205 [Liparis tanakae]
MIRSSDHRCVSRRMSAAELQAAGTLLTRSSSASPRHFSGVTREPNPSSGWRCTKSSSSD